MERRICDDGYIEYKVHWANNTEDQDEWFPRDDLVVEYPRQVEIFEANADRTALPKSITLPPDLPSPASMDGKARVMIWDLQRSKSLKMKFRKVNEN